MTADCSNFVDPDVDFNANFSQIEIALDDDSSDNFPWKSDSWDAPTVISTGFIIISLSAIIIPIIITFIGYPFNDNKKKFEKVTSLGIGYIFRSHAKQILSSYIDEYHIIDEILDYADIIIDSDDLKSTINEQPITKKFLFLRFLVYLLIWIAFIIPFVLTYPVVIDWNDSYKSWIETQCLVVDGTHKCASRNNKNGGCMSRRASFDIDMTKICDPNTIDLDHYHFTANLRSENEEDLDCFIHKDTFEIRHDLGCGCGVKACIRCGDGTCICYGCLLIISLSILGCIIWGLGGLWYNDFTLLYVIEDLPISLV